MSRLRWPDSTNSVSEKPGTIQIATGTIELLKSGRGDERVRETRSSRSGRGAPRALRNQDEGWIKNR